VPAEIRWTDPVADRDARIDVVRRAWHGAYASLLTHEEIDAVFDGSTTIRGEWLARRTGAAGTLVATVDGTVVGLVGLGLMEPGCGEVAALFVVPEHQGAGIGGRLWDAGLAVFRHRGLSRAEVWTMAAAEARGFYEHKGGVLAGEARIWVGDRRLDAVGYSFRLD
jgi:GNAT superfamily N-acetyltransferase